MNSTVSIAIVGSGPAGCYTAQGLRKALPNAQITIYDRLASPFGLVRYGVAPDHQNTKSIQAQFARLFERENVRFAGNLEVGSDVSLKELRSLHNIVVLATGLSRDRALGICGEGLPEVYGAGRLTRLFNAHPLQTVGMPRLGESVAIIGGGNVSIDVLRLLAKQPADFANTDIDDAALAEYMQSPVRHIDFICRSSVANAPSDPVMLAELGRIPGVAFSCLDPFSVPDDASRIAGARAKAIETLLETRGGPDTRVEVSFHFGHAPIQILGDGHVCGVELAATGSQGATNVVVADSVVTAVGFDFDEDDWHGLGPIQANATTGQLGNGLYRTGWVKRGSRGTIAANRACAKSVTEEILRDLPTLDMSTKPGHAGIPWQALAHAVDYDAWKRLDIAESGAAAEGRTRKKFPSHERMVAIANNHLAGALGASEN
ncbi:hypothetical protein CVV68_09460 [Arthrobacter livingstonensis]|uniref:ferredoxin--NADP(+) reductase n=1 Tax=Arthrobacter livingstonensis TaxID=670078 RepID=A0A2V5LCV0_9MICC|nr:FAD-dependent oxidoreductase [Arthrobacter livingstonensis]PYI67653.1 hypothetical protein CVV68_09460 [Arthrobacter livingstonensis]